MTGLAALVLTLRREDAISFLDLASIGGLTISRASLERSAGGASLVLDGTTDLSRGEAERLLAGQKLLRTRSGEWTTSTTAGTVAVRVARTGLRLILRTERRPSRTEASADLPGLRGARILRVQTAFAAVAYAAPPPGYGSAPGSATPSGFIADRTSAWVASLPPGVLAYYSVLGSARAGIGTFDLAPGNPLVPDRWGPLWAIGVDIRVADGSAGSSSR